MADIVRSGDLDVRIISNVTSQTIWEKSQQTMANSMPVVIASDNTVYVQDVSSLYASQDKLYGLCSEVNLSGTSEVDAVLFKNPSGSGKIIYIAKIIFCLISTVGAQLKVRVYKSPTITANGTAITVVPARIGGSPPASVVTAYSLPTISARGTQLRVYVSSDTGTVMDDINSRIIMEANTDLLITGQSSSTNKPVGVTLSWVEL